MSTPRKVLVIGGGAAGNAVTILLRRDGIEVDLVEAKDDWNATAGSGITLQGNALRVLRELGVWDDVKASGFAFGSVGITAPDGTVLHVQRDLRTGGDDLPATVGMQRPRLQHILIEAVRASGATVRLGTTATIENQDDTGVSVRLSDGSKHRYDLVIAADGLGSATRAQIGITDKPEPTGMAIWRAAAPRPAGVERTDLAYGGAAFIMRLLPHQRHHPVRVRGGEEPGPRLHTARVVRAGDAEDRLHVRRRLAYHHRHDHRPVQGQLHLVRPTAGRGFVAPRPRRPHRRRSPLLPPPSRRAPRCRWRTRGCSHSC